MLGFFYAMKEATFTKQIKDFLKEHGCYCVKYFGCAYTQAGVPDLLACINGRFVAIEVKSDKGRPSALQLHNVEKIQQSGGVAMVLYPKDFDKFKSFVLQLLSLS